MSALGGRRYTVRRVEDIIRTLETRKRIEQSRIAQKKRMLEEIERKMLELSERIQKITTSGQPVSQMELIAARAARRELDRLAYEKMRLIRSIIEEERIVKRADEEIMRLRLSAYEKALLPPEERILKTYEEKLREAQLRGDVKEAERLINIILELRRRLGLI